VGTVVWEQRLEPDNRREWKHWRRVGIGMGPGRRRRRRREK
jgi:hypothetical protein